MSNAVCREVKIRREGVCLFVLPSRMNHDDGRGYGQVILKITYYPEIMSIISYHALRAIGFLEFFL